MYIVACRWLIKKKEKKERVIKALQFLFGKVISLGSN